MAAAVLRTSADPSEARYGIRSLGRRPDLRCRHFADKDSVRAFKSGVERATQGDPNDLPFSLRQREDRGAQDQVSSVPVRVAALVLYPSTLLAPESSAARGWYDDLDDGRRRLR